MKKTKLKSHVRNGKLIVNRSQVQKAIESFEGKNITITVEREKQKRSLNYNAYFWGVVIPHIQKAIESSTGDKYPVEEIHEMLKVQFNGVAVWSENKQYRITVPGSTANMTTEGFDAFVKRCVIWAQDFFNIIIPQPNE